MVSLSKLHIFGINMSRTIGFLGSLSLLSGPSHWRYSKAGRQPFLFQITRYCWYWWPKCLPLIAFALTSLTPNRFCDIIHPWREGIYWSELGVSGVNWIHHFCSSIYISFSRNVGIGLFRLISMCCRLLSLHPLSKRSRYVGTDAVLFYSLAVSIYWPYALYWSD